jgi:hypothetical protein
VRSVSTIRLSDQERGQIAAAAARLKLPLSSFLRQAALQASAVVERKVSVRENPPPERELVVVEPRTDHHFVDGTCRRCWRDEDDVADLPCSKQRELVP